MLSWWYSVHCLSLVYSSRQKIIIFRPAVILIPAQ